MPILSHLEKLLHSDLRLMGIDRNRKPRLEIDQVSKLVLWNTNIYKKDISGAY